MFTKNDNKYEKEPKFVFNHPIIYFFEAIRVCAKCGTDQYSKADGARLSSRRYSSNLDALHCTCWRCGHSWYEHCADYKVKPEPRYALTEDLNVFMELNRHGFRITKSKQSDANLIDPYALTIYRFWWNGKMIEEMCDIDRVHDQFYAVKNGHTTWLK